MSQLLHKAMSSAEGGAEAAYNITVTLPPDLNVIHPFI